MKFPVEKLKRFGVLSREVFQKTLSRMFVSTKRTTTGKAILKNLRVMAACLVVLGFTIGFPIGRIFLPSPLKARAASPGPTWLQKIFGSSSALKGELPGGDFLFSDFEEDRSVNAWAAVGAQVERAAEYPSDGIHSMKIIFKPKENLSAVVLDNLLKNRKGGSNWYAYDHLFFTFFTPLKQEAKVLMKITDMWGRQYQETLSFPGGRGVKFRITISKVANVIDAGKIDTISFSVSNLKEPREFYLDQVRLIRGVTAPGEKDAAAAAPLVSKPGDRSVRILDYGFSLRKPAWAVNDPQIEGGLVRVPFMVKNETSSNCVRCIAEGSLPFPAGELKDMKKSRLRNRNNEDIPFQPRILARWPDGSVKWLFLSFEINLRPAAVAGLFLDYGPNAKTIDFSSPLLWDEDKNEIRIRTGTMRVTFSKEKLLLFKEIEADLNGDGALTEDEKVTTNAVFTLRFRGEEYRADLSAEPFEIKIEEAGRKRIVVRTEGWLSSPAGEKFCKIILRYYFYENQNLVKLSHTLVYTGYPANDHFFKYKGIELPQNEAVESFGFRLPLSLGAHETAVRFGRDNGPPLSFAAPDAPRVFQQGWEASSASAGGEPVKEPGLFNGWAEVSAGGKSAGVLVRRFRENFPKAFSYDKDGVLSVDLWPAEAGPMDLSTTAQALGNESVARGSAFGMGKTHEIFFQFSGPALAAGDSLPAYMRRLLIRPNPYWVDATGALGRLAASDRRFGEHEAMLESLFDWAARMPQLFKWYGMLNFGDTLTWWRKEKTADGKEEFGWHPEGRWGWYNVEGPGTHTGALLQFLRTGAWKYFEFGENLARHVMDVDTVHYNTVANDPRLRSVISDEYSRVGSMHRHNADHWGDRNEETSHTNVVGLLLYYYMTGDERAFEVAQEVGEFYLARPYTYAEHPDIAPQRSLANALWGDVALFHATGDTRYKRAADELIDIFLAGQNPDGSIPETYNPQTSKWTGGLHELYMSWYTVSALVSYHELTQDETVKEMLLKLVRYLAPREYPGPSILHGIAYSYLITKDPQFIQMAEMNLERLFKNKVKDPDPMIDGQIYRKPIYHRPNIFLSTVPYVFGALEEHFQATRKKV